jgi:5'-nucleotidase
MSGDVRHDVLVDMDGVLAGFDASVEATILANHPEIEIVRPRQNFYIHEDYPEEHHLAIKGIWQAEGFYRQLPLIPRAREGWNEIVELGFFPIVCSSPIPQNPNCIVEKKDWLEQYFVPSFGYSVIDEAIFDRDKSKYGALALIDDKSEIPNASQASWKHILFNAPYNQGSNARLRLEGWDDPRLSKLLHDGRLSDWVIGNSTNRQ